ncbi:hypothetical protein DITRI_Ditri05aG0054500 [Diplodiscus trichospermus]
MQKGVLRVQLDRTFEDPSSLQGLECFYLVARVVLILPFFFLSHPSFSADTITLGRSIRDNGGLIVSSALAAPRIDMLASGILSIDSRENLVLFQRNQTLPVWSTNISITGTSNSIAQLLDLGNLVLLQNDTRTVLWQSFDHPTNTLLPFMKFGLSFRTGPNRFLTSWKSPDDPGIGNYSFRINPSGFPQLYLYKGSSPWWRGASWTGQRWSGIPEMTRNYVLNYSFVNNDEEVSFVNRLNNKAEKSIASIITRMILNETGITKRFTWNNEAHRWIGFWSAPKERCDFYLHYGPNSYCNPDSPKNFECKCFPGLPQAGVSTCQSGEGFVKVARMKVPDTAEAQVDMSLGLKDCKDNCLRNCSYMAYASAYYESNGGIGCLTWHGDLVEARTFANAGQDLYIRVDADELGMPSTFMSFCSQYLLPCA